MSHSSNSAATSSSIAIWLVYELATFTSTHPNIIIQKISSPLWNGPDVKHLAMWRCRI